MKFALTLTFLGVTSLSFLLITNEAVDRPSSLQEPQQEAPKKLLFLTHAGLYKHTSLQPAEEAVASWGPASGYELTTLQGYLQDQQALDLSIITPDYLAQFDGLMMMTNGNLPLADSQKRALVDFVKNGGGFVGVHNASLSLYN